MDNTLYYVLLAPPILIALTVHEFAHALIAYRLGDDTAKSQGRLTLNPLKHLDFLGTIMLFIVQLGWARPVPVNPANFRNPKSGMFWVALAGPVSNVLLALAFGLAYRAMLGYDSLSIAGSYLQFMLRIAVMINLLLAFFNLIPIPPLDGSKLLFSFVPDRYSKAMNWFSRFGPFVLLALIFGGRRFNVEIIWGLIGPPVHALAGLFANIQF